MDVFVTDGEQRSTLAVTRSLGRRGINVTVGEQRRNSLAASSKYCHCEYVYPSPLKNPSRFQEEIIRYMRTRAHRMIIPMTDVTCILINEIRDKLEPFTYIALPERRVFDQASNKAQLMRLAASLGIPIPKTEFPENINQMKSLAGEIKFPVVIKPVRSRLQTPYGWVHGTVEYAYSKEELIKKYNAIHSKIAHPLIQERIDGVGYGVFLLFTNGQPKAYFAHRRIREKPPSGGVSVLREAVKPDENILGHSCRLLEVLNWNGVAMVEFKIDRHSNTPRLMEVNGRLWGSLQLAIDAGVDFPYLLYQATLGQNIENIRDYRTGVKTRWLLGDLDHLMIILLKKRKRLALPNNFPGKLGTLWEFTKSFFDPDTNLEIWQRDDLKPAFNEFMGYTRAGIASLRARLFQRKADM